MNTTSTYHAPTYEPTRLLSNSYSVFCLKKKKLTHDKYFYLG